MKILLHVIAITNADRQFTSALQPVSHNTNVAC